MNKKQLAAFVESLVTRTAETQGISEAEARSFVSVAIRRLASQIVGSGPQSPPQATETAAA